MRQLLFFLYLGLLISNIQAQTSAVEPVESGNIERTLEQEAKRRETLSQQAHKHFQKAQEFYEAGKYNLAEWECDQMGEQNLSFDTTLKEEMKKLHEDIFVTQAREAVHAKNWIKAEVYLHAIAPLAPQRIEVAQMIDQVRSARGKTCKLPPLKTASQLSMPTQASISQHSELMTACLNEGKEALACGKLDEAEVAFQDILADQTREPKDPYSIAAAQELEKVYAKRKARIEENAQRVQGDYLTQVRAAWSQPIQSEALPISTSSTSYSDEALHVQHTRDIEHKLETIRLPEINFTNASLSDIATFLTQQSRKLDPQKIGVSILVHEDALAHAKPITLALREVPLGEAIRYTARLAEVKSKVEEAGVFLLPLAAEYNPLVTREFAVREAFFYQQDPFEDLAHLSQEIPVSSPSTIHSKDFKLAKQHKAHTQAERIRQALEAKSVLFPEGATAIYSPSTGILTVRNTEDQLEYIEQLVASDVASQGRARMIQIETRILEINQTDLDDLSFNWSIEGGIVPGSFYPGQKHGTHYNFTSTEARTHLGGANALPSSSLENLTGAKASSAIGQTISENSLYLSGFLDGTGFTALITALSQKKNVNLMSAPAILMKSGGPGALIEVVREFIYPTEFSPPQVYLPTLMDESDATATFKGPPSPIAIPAWPKEFVKEPRKVGVRIKVKKAQADEHNQKISLELEPEITDFDGFIDYGSRIYTVVGYFGKPVKTIGPDGQPRQLLSENKIRIPVFTVRSFDGGFKLDVKDGYTMVLGGLIREEVQTVHDKVPVLGDVPLVGRLFRSNAQRMIRKNLILFVTPRILEPNGTPVNLSK